MNVLFIERHADRTGGPRVLHSVANALREAGHQVTVVFGQAGSADDSDGSFIAEARDVGIDVIAMPALVPSPRPSAVRQLVREARKRHVDVVVGVAQRDRPLASLVAGLIGRAAVVFVLNEQRFVGRAARMKRWFYARALRRRCVWVVAPTARLLAEVRDLGVAPHRSRLLPNAIEPLPDAPPADIRAELGLGADTPIVVGIARIHPQKAVHEAIEAFATGAPEHAHLLLAGSGAGSESIRAAERIEAAIRRHDCAQRVHRLGFRSDATSLLAEADAFIHSAHWEGFPLVVLLALQSGCPAVFTDAAGALPGFVDGVHGWMRPVGDIEGLSSALERALHLTQPERAALAASAIDLVEKRYSIDAIRPALEGLFDEVRS